MTRIVVDTNVFVASAYNSGSASRRIIEACESRDLDVVVSPEITREYDHILPRAIRSRDQLQRAMDLIRSARVAVPSSTPRVVADDPDDDKFVAAAVAAKADAIVTNDQGLLAVDPHDGIRILRPVVFLQIWPQPPDVTRTTCDRDA